MVIQSLWIGPRFSTMERLAISSFLRLGHEVHLYSYGPVEGVPTGTTMRDGREILPERSIFAYRSGFGEGSYSAFSNFFRYRLLLERGGWWVDCDVVALRAFAFADDHVLASERLRPDSDESIVSTAVLKQPAGSALMAWCWDRCQQTSVETLAWGQIGPRLLQEGVNHFGLHDRVQSEETFSPVPHFECRRFVDPSRSPPIGDGVFAIHLWHQMWVHEQIDPEAGFPAESLYEQLKRRVLSP